MKPLALSPARLRGIEVFFWLALASSFFLLPDKLTLMSQIMKWAIKTRRRPGPNPVA